MSSNSEGRSAAPSARSDGLDVLMAARMALDIDNAAPAGKSAKNAGIFPKTHPHAYGATHFQGTGSGGSRPAPACLSIPGAHFPMRDASLTLSFRHVVLALAALTIIRIIGLHFSSVDFYVDEAQYWAWSRHLAFGYFTKPPLLAWLIAGTDAVCGTGAACTRSVSPLIYFVACLLVYAIAGELYDRRTAAWSALTFALATGLSFSARIISTDVPLILFWALTLFSYVKLLRAPDWRWALVLGIALGLGTLAKYAMVYFILCALCAALVDRPARAFIARPQSWVALLIAALIVSPNAYWNAAHNFVTFHHTGYNITGSGFHLRLVAPFEFIGAQFGLAGPLVFGAFVVLLTQIGRGKLKREDRLMLAFALPVLALIVALGFVRRSNANWAAPAILSLTILVVAWWVRYGYWRLIEITLAIGLFVQVVFLVGDAFAYRVSLPPLGRHADVYQRTLGWRAFGARAASLAQKAQTPTVVSESRAEVAALLFYLRDKPLRVLSWPPGKRPRNEFDLVRRFNDKAAEPVLFVSACGTAERLARYFEDVTPLGAFTVASGPRSGRRFYAFVLNHRTRPIGPLGPCAGGG